MPDWLQVVLALTLPIIWGVGSAWLFDIIRGRLRSRRLGNGQDEPQR